MVNPASLSQTLDAVNEAGRQGLPGSYGGTFAGFPAERNEGILVFTGERMTSASARHILGEEACRALRKLNVADATARNALDRADEGLRQCLVPALSEMDLAEAREELAYAAEPLRRAADRPPGDSSYPRRRHQLAGRVAAAAGG